MSNEKIQELAAKLEKGWEKTRQILGDLAPGQWEMVLYDQPYPWTSRDLLAHFLSAEEHLLLLGKDIAAGGEGAPADFDYDEFNQQEQERLALLPPMELLARADAARKETLQWVGSLQESKLENKGLHPALGIVDLETLILSIYGHQLLHMREVRSRLIENY